MNLLELRNELRTMCDKEGGALPWGLKQKPKISHSYISAVLRGDAKPGKKILKAMAKTKGAKKTQAVMDFRFDDVN